MEENATLFLCFSGKCNELAKRAYRAKRVHQYSLNISVFLKNSLSALTALSEFFPEHRCLYEHSLSAHYALSKFIS